MTNHGKAEPLKQLSPWFLMGSLVTFTGMLLAFPTWAPDASGTDSIRYTLVEYYRTNLSRLLESNSTGPGINPLQLALLTVVLLSCSLSGGLMGIGLERVLLRRKLRQEIRQATS